MWTFANSILRDSRALLSAQLKELNLTPSEGTILLQLHLSDDALIQEHLAEQLEVSKPAISKALDSLEAKGFVQRQNDPTNGRINVVMLTAKAHAVAEDIKRIYTDLYTAASRDITEEEAQLLESLARRVSENLRAYKELNLGA